MESIEPAGEIDEDIVHRVKLNDQSDDERVITRSL